MSKQRIVATLHGGASYAEEENATLYPSLDEAKREWMWRRDGKYGFPCWGDPSYQTAIGDGTRHHAGYAWLVNDDDLEELGVDIDGCGFFYVMEDLYPDYELTVGPRGGLRWEKC